VSKFVGKNSRVATILSLGIEHRTAVDPVPISMRTSEMVVTLLPFRSRRVKLSERSRLSAFTGR